MNLCEYIAMLSLNLFLIAKIKAKINIAGPSSRTIRRMNQDSEFTKGTEIQVQYVYDILIIISKCAVIHVP